MNSSLQTAIATDWDAYWQSDLDTKEWEYLHEVIIRVLRREIFLPQTCVAELGSGSGRISLRLATEGRRIVLLDSSRTALEIGRQRFQKQGQVSVGVLQSDIRFLPFRGGSFPAMWNAGVMEHFDSRTQSKIVHDCLRCLQPGGVFVTLNPNEGCLLHTMGRWIIQQLARYPFEDEGLVRTMKPLVTNPANCHEYSVGFVVLLPGMLKRLMLMRGLRRPAGFAFRVVDEAFCAISRTRAGDWLEACDRFLARLLGGYLLVSVLRKNTPP